MSTHLLFLDCMFLCIRLWSTSSRFSKYMKKKNILESSKPKEDVAILRLEKKVNTIIYNIHVDSTCESAHPSLWCCSLFSRYFSNTLQALDTSLKKEPATFKVKLCHKNTQQTQSQNEIFQNKLINGSVVVSSIFLSIHYFS